MSTLATAKRLIDKHGREITLQKMSIVPADPNNPQDGSTTAPAELVVNAVQDAYTEEQMDSVIERGDVKFLVWGGTATDVETYDKIVDGSTKWRIISVEPIRPGTFTYLYTIQARR